VPGLLQSPQPPPGTPPPPPAGSGLHPGGHPGLSTPPGFFSGAAPPPLPTDVQGQKRQLLVTGLPRGLGENDVRVLFEVCGPLASVTKAPEQVRGV
jgi:hypothetical protein